MLAASSEPLESLNAAAVGLPCSSDIGRPATPRYEGGAVLGLGDGCPTCGEPSSSDFPVYGDDSTGGFISPYIGVGSSEFDCMLRGGGSALRLRRRRQKRKKARAMSASAATGTPTAGPIMDPRLFELDELAAGLPVEETGTATLADVEVTRVL